MLQQSLFFFLSPGDRCIQSGFWEKTSRWYFCSVTFCLHLTQYSCTSFKHSKPLRVSFLCGWAILDQPIFIEGKTIFLDSSYSWARGHGGVIALREIHSGTTRFYNSNCRLFFFFPVSLDFLWKTFVSGDQIRTSAIFLCNYSLVQCWTEGLN